MTRFSHLSAKSHYSLLDGLPKIDALVDQASYFGMPALALTDRNNLYGAIEFYKTAKKTGVKPIIGVDLDIDIANAQNHIVFLAENNEGYQNLLKLVSKAQIEYPNAPHATAVHLEKYGKGLIALIPDTALLGHGSAALVEELWKYIGKGSVYARLPGTAREEQLRIAGVAKALSLPLAASDATYYLKPEDREVRDTVRKIANPSAEPDDIDRTFYSVDSAEERFHDFPEALKNTEAIAERATVELALGAWRFPSFPIAEGTTYEEELEKAARSGAARRGIELSGELEKRLAYELSIINKKGFAPYFLTVADLLSFARTNGILTTTRGSAAGSLVSYLTGITTVDPIAYKLPFERFLNPERPSAPDIDMDFADTRRDEMIAYAKKRYGEEAVAQIGTFGTMMARAAVRDVARALGYPYGVGDRIAKMIPIGSQGFPMTIDRALEIEADLKNLYRSDEDAEIIIDTAKRIEGNARHISIHAAGIVIAPTSATDFVPVQYDPHGTSVITQYDMHAVEDAGLLKFDFLGLKNLSVLGDAIERVRIRKGESIDIENIPLDDAQVFAMLTRGETEGVFQLGGSGMTHYLKDLKPTSIDDINAMVALYRPGPMEMIPQYIARKQNPGLITHIDPRMKDILERSYGIITYQDDVLLTAITLAGYSWLEADNLRKAMGKKIPAEMKAQKEKFIEGCVNYGKLTRGKAEAVWKLIEPFAAYGFNKCLTGDTRIFSPLSGKLETLQSLLNRKDSISVAALNTDKKIISSSAQWVRKNGIKPVYRMQTRSGRVIRATKNHPLLGFDGWQALEKFKPGMRIAVPRKLPEPSAAMQIPAHEASALGYLLSEGNLCHPHGLYFYSTQENEIADFTRAALCFPNTHITLNRSKSAISAYVGRKASHGKNGMMVWAKGLGILGKRATEKYVPDAAFTWNNEATALLLGKMWQGDGTISLKNQQAFYATSADRLAHDVQHLLLRFSILSTIHHKKFKYRGMIKNGYTIVVSGAENLNRLSTAISPHLIGSKRTLMEMVAQNSLQRSNNRGRGTYDTVPAQILTQIRSELATADISVGFLSQTTGLSLRTLSFDSRKRGYTRDVVARLGKAIKSADIISHAESDIFWDEVKTIEADGEEMTYDLSVPELENFVANDVIVHNSHAASYGKVAYQTAYMKTHHTEDYMAALLSADAGDVEKIAEHVGECARIGIRILPPDVNESFETFTVIAAGMIRFGLSSIKNFGEGAAKAIIDERTKNGKFSGIGDFLSRMPGNFSNKRALEALIKTGTFDSFSERGALLSNMEKLLAFAKDINAAPENQSSLFGAMPKNTNVVLDIAPRASPTDMLSWEKELLGIYVSGHPLDRFASALRDYQGSLKAAKAEERNNFPLAVAGVVETVKTILTKKGDRMGFVTIADKETSLEGVAFPEVFKTNQSALQAGVCVLMKGKITERNGTKSLLIEKVKMLS